VLLSESIGKNMIRKAAGGVIPVNDVDADACLVL